MNFAFTWPGRHANYFLTGHNTYESVFLTSCVELLESHDLPRCKIIPFDYNMYDQTY